MAQTSTYSDGQAAIDHRVVTGTDRCDLNEKPFGVRCRCGAAKIVSTMQTTAHKLREKLMPTGTVKWFNAQKGFGFIQPDNGGTDVFVHISAVERAGMNDLREGQKLDFELVSDSRSGKMSAGNLQAVD
jgi:CspA family cold shock protein